MPPASQLLVCLIQMKIVDLNMPSLHHWLMGIIRYFNLTIKLGKYYSIYLMSAYVTLLIYLTGCPGPVPLAGFCLGLTRSRPKHHGGYYSEQQVPLETGGGRHGWGGLWALMYQLWHRHRHHTSSASSICLRDFLSYCRWFWILLCKSFQTDFPLR